MVAVDSVHLPHHPCRRLHPLQSRQPARRVLPQVRCTSMHLGTTATLRAHATMEVTTQSGSGEYTECRRRYDRHVVMWVGRASGDFSIFFFFKNPPPPEISLLPHPDPLPI